MYITSKLFFIGSFLSRLIFKIPPPRILVMGVRGSGKSTQARFLADRLNVFHVKFRDYLQELIIGKTKKRIEPEHEEEKVVDDAEEEEEEDEDDIKEREKSKPPASSDTMSEK